MKNKRFVFEVLYNLQKKMAEIVIKLNCITIKNYCCVIKSC